MCDVISSETKNDCTIKLTERKKKQQHPSGNNQDN